jgi:eukaryotic-like serine/threonine-protein kinase
LPQIDSMDNWAPVWTADGERIVFISSGERGDRVFWQRADGSGRGEHLLDARAAEWWMPDGRRMTYLTLTRNGDDDYGDYGIRLLDIETRTTTGLIDLAGSAQHSSSVSPDGRWLAYVSNETGRLEVWLEPLPRTGERHRLTRRGGEHPLWSPDGETLYFDRDHRLYRVGVDLDGRFEAGAPEALPITGFEQGEYRRQYDLMPDGRRFLMMYPIPDDSARQP